jgi:SAM-dependent methyltransferase
MRAGTQPDGVQGTLVTGGDGATIAACADTLGREPAGVTNGGLASWPLERPAEEARRAAAALGSAAELHLDRFHLLPPPDPAGRAALVGAFFDWLAEDYDQVTDVDRNAANIRALHELLAAHGVHDGARLLDFGCGTGLAARVLDGPALVGFDQSEAMRALAARAGAHVWGPRELAAQGRGSLDAGLASYVLHLGTGPKLVRAALERMREGALFAANFHRRLGTRWAAAIFASAGMSVVHEGDGGPHGTYVVYEKGSASGRGVSTTTGIRRGRARRS